MSRPTCWHCGKQLMYVKGKPVWHEYTDPLGHVHKLHKLCADQHGYKVKEPTAVVTNECFDISGKYAGVLK